MKKLLWIPIGFILLLFVIFILAGTPLILNIIKGKLETTLESNIGKPVHIGSLKGNLFYAVSIDKFEIADIVAVDRVKVSYSILQLIYKKIDIHSIIIDGLFIDMNRIETLTKNIPSTKKEKSEKETKIPFVIHIRELSIQNSNLLSTLNNQNMTLSVALQGSLFPDVFVIDSLMLKTRESNISVHGRIPLKEGTNLSLVYNLTILCDEFNIEGLTGMMNGSGEITGSTSSPRIVSTLNFDIDYQKTDVYGHIACDWQLPNFDDLNCTVTATAQTALLTRTRGEKDRWDVTLRAKGKKFLCDISSQYGYATLQGVYGGDMENPEFDGKLTGALTYAEFKSTIQGNILYNNKTLDVKRIRMSNDELLIQVNASVIVKDPATITADILLSCTDIGVINTFIENPLPITGKFNVSTKMSGKLANPDVVSTVTLEDVNLYNEQIESGTVLITLKNHTVNIERGLLHSARGIINVTGMYNVKTSMFSTHLYSDEVTFSSPEVFGTDTFPLSGHMSFDVEFYGNPLNPDGRGRVVFHDFTYDTLMFDTYELDFTFTDNTAHFNVLNDKENVHFDAQIMVQQPYFFTALITLDHFDLGDFIPSDSAYITAQVSVEGRTDEIESISGNIQIETLYVAAREHELSNAERIAIDIGNGLIDIRSCVMKLHSDSISLHGTIPLSQTQGNFDLTCQSSRIDITRIAALLPQALEITGYFTVDMSITGKPSTPEINGFVTFESVKYAMPDIIIDSVYGTVKFRNRAVTIDNLKGKINKGTFKSSGSLTVSNGDVSTLDIMLSLDAIDFNHKEFGSVVLSSDIKATGKKDSIRVTGEVTIDKAVYGAPFNMQTIVKLLTSANRPPPEQGKILKQTYCDIGISTPHGAKIANNVAHVEIDMDLQLKGYLSQLNVYGTASTLKKGYVQYLNKKFDIVHAVIAFDNPYKIDPVLDLEALHFISSEKDTYEIQMHLSGTVEKWSLSLTSFPTLPEQDIISLLLIGKRRPSKEIFTELQDIDLKETAKEYATSLVTGEIERRVEKTLGLEEFTITGDILDPRRLNIGIEKRFAKKFTFVYGMGIESWELQRIGLNYDITDNFSIFTLHDQENMNSSVDFDIHFNLK
ncbi:hypothetical protein AMJ52_05430 [candidate division TA06 bacterium DG_78]|uniref:Translocation and assembly module TamB C-terminal domain-containing protein n=1 Tax=candidate division TA06 bacterium DG_78 TaxID=1703772 RepID=A0A0S7YD66_UNCT6|nr:MAG: hypothetical protein AMJ52_05430 [candidate division TA06 bacterium DG_78]